MRDRESARYWLTLFDKYKKNSLSLTNKIFYLLTLTHFSGHFSPRAPPVSVAERGVVSASHWNGIFTQFCVSDLSLKIFWTLIWKPLKHIYFHLMMLRSIFLSSSVTCNGSMRLGMEIIWEESYWGWRSLRREFYVDYCSGYWQWEDQFSPYINDKTLIRNEVDTW